MLYRKFLRKKTQLSDVVSEFVIFLKLGVLWWKLKIFISNFSYLSLNRFWRIFSMLLNSHPTIKWRWKKNSVAIILMLNRNLTGLIPANELDLLLSKIFISVRKQNGTEYEPGTLSGFDFFLTQTKRRFLITPLERPVLDDFSKQTFSQTSLHS